MKGKRPDCVGNCRLCDSIGSCPADIVCCEDCGVELEQGEGIEIEVEQVERVERGRRGSKMITVCAECFASYYQGEETGED